jgi:hypothetical protein
MMAAALGVATVAGAVIVVHALTAPAKISLSSNSSRADHFHSMPGMTQGTFTTVNNQMDPTFNQLLGINNRGTIAGYFGSGAKHHPNRGYLLHVGRVHAFFLNENFPGARQTQVTGLNDRGVTVGFWSRQNRASQMNNNFGFYTWHGRFHNVNFPTWNRAMPPVNQLLGVNDRDMAVGFYTNGQGVNRGYEYDIRSHMFSRVLIPGIPNLSKSVSLTATAINNRGDVAGFYSVGGGMTSAFLKTGMGMFTKLAYPGATSTQAFGVNDWREVVGAYTMGSGNSAKTFGFTWTQRAGFMSVSDPMGVGTTLLNGVNDQGALVGFYTDSAGNTDGMVWAPMHMHGMPQPSQSPTAPMTTQPMTTPPMTTPPMTTPTTAPTTPAPASSPPGGPW